ncbi:MAG: signal peptidase I [Eubacterium sp.]|nr:signal peptidase I [Eubacterium sp.]
MSKNKEKSTGGHKALTTIGIILCVILIPILVINMTLIIKSYTNTEEVPKIGGYAPLIVLTGSMEPEIMSGDLIIVKQIDGQDVKEKDVIAFFDPDGNGTSIVTHRVIEVYEKEGTLYFKTQGDANDSADRLPVSEEDIVGIYLTRIGGAGNVAMFMQTTAGLIVCVVVPLVLLIAWDIFRRKRYEKANKQDTDALLAELEELKAAKAQEQKNSDSE